MRILIFSASTVFISTTRIIKFIFRDSPAVGLGWGPTAGESRKMILCILLQCMDIDRDAVSDEMPDAVGSRDCFFGRVEALVMEPNNVIGAHSTIS